MGLRSPLPPRDGLHAVWVRTTDRNPADTYPWRSLGEFLQGRLAASAPVTSMLEEGRFVFCDGSAVTGSEPYVPNTFIWFHRVLAPEPDEDWDLPLLHSDDRLVVLDKPSGLSSIPRGQHVRRSAVVLLRLRLGLPDLSPVHRLDRLTAGVLVFTTEQRWRRPYQQVFERRQAHKVYEAIAGVQPGWEVPVVVRSHIVKARGSLQAVELPDRAPNAETTVERIETHGDHALYRLYPTTGRTHQLRVHMNALGIPIAGDPLYPEPSGGALDGPLQLAARSVTFVDPIDGRERQFTSRAPLVWP